MAKPLKILAIQFKSLGDTVLVVPALEAIRQQFPDCILHALVSESAAPLLKNQPGIARVWSTPRVHGKTRLKQSWPVIRALRAERFDRSVDFGGNDRGAIMSLMCGARKRLGIADPDGFFGRNYICYTQRSPVQPIRRPEPWRSMAILAPWGITPKNPAEIRIHADPALDAEAARLLPAGAIVCHMGAGMSCKQWPVAHWAKFHALATTAGFHLVFTPGAIPREKVLATELKNLVPTVSILPDTTNLALFMAVLKRARALVTPDTGPMHIAAALGTPLVAMFGPSSIIQWAPVSRNCRVLRTDYCECDMIQHECQSAVHCMTTLSPELVLANLQDLLERE